MPLGTLKSWATGAGSGGGGGGNSGSPWASYGEMQARNNPMSTQQQAALGWLQGSVGLGASDYNSTLSRLNAQRAAAGGAYGQAASAANRGYGLDMRGHDLTERGINEDLLFGTQLRNQDKYRNVTLGRARAGADYTNARGIWAILQDDLRGQRGFNRRNFSMRDLQIGQQHNVGMRQVGSDAISRGARTARGTIDQFGDVRATRNIDQGFNRINYDTAQHGLNMDYRRGARAFNHAATTYGLDMKTFNSLAKTYGIQNAQAIAQANLGRDQVALARDKSGAARDSAVGAAGANRSQALAGLAGQGDQARNAFLQQVMAAQQQLYGLTG